MRRILEATVVGGAVAAAALYGAIVLIGVVLMVRFILEFVWMMF